MQTTFVSRSAWLILLLTNAAFVWKYSARTSFSPLLCTGLYALFLLSIALFCERKLFSPKTARCITLALLAVAFAGIAVLLMRIDPLSVNVDRWSATTYWLDALFQGIYPYGVHTHVCETNFPSPLPLWHYLNLPFWLLGDVGLGLFVFLAMFVAAVFWFTRSWRQTSVALLLLVASPAYWWEVLVRSDGLSNALLVFCLILLMEKKGITPQRHWLLCAVICALTALTRLSAIIPMALYVAKDYLKSPLSRQVAIALTVIVIVFAFFAPFIFWDTDSWVFFHRNPFMSQTSTGSPWILLFMAAFALWLIWSYNRSFSRFVRSTAWFMFGFFLLSIVYNHFAYNANVSPFDDADFDISYLTLSLPYCLFAIATRKPQEE